MRGRERGGRPPSDFRAGIPKRALDFVTSPEKRYKQNKIQNSESRGRNAAGRRRHGPVAPAVKWIPPVQQSQCRLSGFLSLLLPALSMSRGPLSSFTPSSPPLPSNSAVCDPLLSVSIFFHTLFALVLASSHRTFGGCGCLSGKKRSSPAADVFHAFLIFLC